MLRPMPLPLAKETNAAQTDSASGEPTPTEPTSTEHSVALEFLWSRIDYERTSSVPYTGRSFKLDRMRQMLAMLGDPQAKQKIVHIGGTKGKGSTAAMISTILAAAGFRTGTYSSPHLHCLEERMAIDGQPCSAQDLIELIEIVRPVVEQLDADADASETSLGRPTYFEVATAMALVHFARSEVDATVLEVGLGGRLDSTNVCEPLVSVITNISLDHTKQLGSTLASIAGEKAGIIKPGVPVVSGVVETEPRDVIRQVAEQRGSKLLELRRDFDFDYRPPRALGRSEQFGELAYRERDTTAEPTILQPLQLSLVGRHQAANAALAIAAINVLRDNVLRDLGWDVPESAVQRGLATTVCPARVEVLRGEPTVVIDAAHNVASIEALLATLDESFGSRRRVFLFDTTQDKDARGMLAAILGACDELVLTRYLNNPRYVPPAELAAIARELNILQQRTINVCDDPTTAWHLAGELAGSDDLICVTGSFFIAAEIRQLCRATR